MLATLIPLFDENMAVRAYSLFAQKKNYLLNPMSYTTGYFDGAGSIPGLDVIENMGIDTLPGDTEVFVAVDNVSVFADINSIYNASHDRLVLLADQSVVPDAIYISRLKTLKRLGYKLAIRNLAEDKLEEYFELLLLMDYILIDHKKCNITEVKNYFKNVHLHINICVVNVDSQDEFENLKADGGYSLYEGEFYRLPVTKGEEEVSPLKMNYIELLNVVNSEDFDLTQAAEIISRDTALVISLLKIVNRIAINSEITSINHAAAMLGQRELKKWISTVVTKELCADKPNEITRISLLRAKFAESLAMLFDMKIQAPELFLMGLFSVIDLILGQPMDKALEIIKLSANIKEALIEQKGELAPVLDFIQQYEEASWQEVSRQMLLHKIDMNDVYDAYINSLKWYRDLFR